MTLLRGKGWGLDGAQAVGFAAMLLLAAQAQALQLALRPTAEGSQAAFTALLWVPQLYGALAAPFVNRKLPRALGLGLVLAGAVLLAAHVGATYAGLRPARCSSLPRPACRARRRAGGAALCGPSGVDKRRRGA